MINHLSLIRNIGQFDNVNAGRQIPLAKLSLVYSENGRGKTTITAVLRSFATGDPLPISERRRLTAQNPPHVVLDHDNVRSPAVFQNNQWNHSIPGIAIFDDVFVDQNVCSGISVGSQHRQNLHELILGASAVGLSHQLQSLVEIIEGYNRELRAREAEIPVMVRGPFSVLEFCDLPRHQNVDQAIQDTERAVAAARVQDAIRNTPTFDLLNLPDVDLSIIERVLQRDLPTLDAETLKRVQEHLTQLGSGGESWVSDGVRRISTHENNVDIDLCPFCAQELQESPLINHYRAYFSQAYGDLKHTISITLDDFNRVHSGEVFAGFERTVRVAIERRQFWTQYCEVAEVSIDTSQIVRAWQASRESILTLLRVKNAAPLDSLTITEETRAAVQIYQDHLAQIATINQMLQTANQQIAVAKERAANADLTLLEHDRVRLLAQRARHTPDITTRCRAYLATRLRKIRAENRRTRIRTVLNQQRTALFQLYENSINDYLRRFNAGFRLDSITPVNIRPGSTCTYNVIIHNVQVQIGGANPAPGAPSFRSTLSAGDRNSLALAFFFASLDQDPDLANKVVIIDDPISSLDDHRTLTTIEEIRRLITRTAQVMVLSHNKPMLCRLWEGTDTNNTTSLEVVRENNGSTMRLWDVYQDSINEHDRRHIRLQDYLNGSPTGDLREIARSIRPHLEAFLRVAYPGSFHPGNLIGPFLGICNQRLDTNDEILNQNDVRDLRALNTYSSRYHHNTNPAWDTEIVNDGELRGFVERTLRFVHRGN
jgi:wobble nucleotide-excising tRNase